MARTEGEASGAAKVGGALLSGLLRCGRCGRKLQVLYSNGGRYRATFCHGDRGDRGSSRCLTVGSLKSGSRGGAQRPERDYLNHVADRFNLRPNIDFDTRVNSAIFDESANLWDIHTDRHPPVSARFCIMATGCLSAARVPEYPGLNTFQGKWYHTGNWPRDEGVDFTGKRVGVIGTDSSGIQLIPIIAEQASALYVFQRTPTFSVPAHNGPLSEEVIEDWNTKHTVYHDQARNSVFGILSLDLNERSALEASPEERQRAYEQRSSRAGLQPTFQRTCVQKALPKHPAGTRGVTGPDTGPEHGGEKSSSEWLCS